MNSTTHSQLAFHAHTISSKIEEFAIQALGTFPRTAKIFDFEIKASFPEPQSEFDLFMAELESDPANAEELAEAGAWVAEKLYGHEGETLKSVRLKKGLSQKQLAEMIGTTQPRIATLEKGTQDPLLSTVEKLAKALDVSIDALSKMLELQRNLNQAKGIK